MRKLILPFVGIYRLSFVFFITVYSTPFDFTNFKKVHPVFQTAFYKNSIFFMAYRKSLLLDTGGF